MNMSDFCLCADKGDALVQQLKHAGWFKPMFLPQRECNSTHGDVTSRAWGPEMLPLTWLPGVDTENKGAPTL